MANERRLAGLPRWVKASLWTGVGLVVLAVVMMALGHNPLQHMLNHAGMSGMAG